MKLPSIFSEAASFFSSFVPKTLKPDPDTAYVVTKFNPITDAHATRVVVKDASVSYFPATALDVTEVSLKPETIHLERNGEDSITLLDKTKADVTIDFEVGVDGANDQSIIAAAIIKPISLEYLGGKFDSALRLAGAQTHSLSEFSVRAAELVEQAIDVSHLGLKPVHVTAVSAKPAPASSYDPNDYFDAQGLKIAYPDQSGPNIKPA